MKTSNQRTWPVPTIRGRLRIGFALLALSGIVLGSCTARDSETTAPSPMPGAYRLLGEAGEIEFPFEIFRSDIRFLCEVNGRRVHMLLDDGFMWDQLLFWGGPEVDSLGLAYDGEIAVGGEDTEKLASKTASGITVELPGVEFTEQTAVIMPSAAGTSRMWRGSVGQISATFFKHFVVDINFDRMIISLKDPEKYQYQGKGSEVPWQPLGFGPWSIPAELQMEDGRRASMKLLMDLGYNDQLQLVVGGEHEIALPRKKLPASLGFNIQRVETRGFIGRLPLIDIGGYQVVNPIVSYVSEDYSQHAVYEAMIGLGLLSRFNLVFDLKRHRLFVEPNRSFDKPFEYNMSGIQMRPTFDGDIVIKEIHRHSPAEKAGLRVGDRILRIDDKPIADYDLFELRSKLMKEGAEITLSVDSNGEEKDVSIVLRRLI